MERPSKNFFRKNLSTLAILLSLVSLLLPWARHDSYGNWLLVWPSIEKSVVFWPFMAMVWNGDLSYHNYWYDTEFDFFRGSPYDYFPFGLYFGWNLLLLCQALVLFFWLNSRFQWLRVWRAWHPFLVVTFLSGAPLLGFWQFSLQERCGLDGTYCTVFLNQMFRFQTLYPGFLIAILPAFLGWISYSRSSEYERFLRLRGLLGRRWKTAMPLLVVLSFALWVATNEFYSDTYVTKSMVVERIEPEDPQLWQEDVDKIAAVAEVFRAKVRCKSTYFYCYVEVPLPSFDILLSIYTSMGYEAREEAYARLIGPGNVN